MKTKKITDPDNELVELIDGLGDYAKEEEKLNIS